jgi:hypothetical protein
MGWCCEVRGSAKHQLQLSGCLDSCLAVTVVWLTLTVKFCDRSTEDRFRRCAFVKSRTVLVILADKSSAQLACLCNALCSCKPIHLLLDSSLCNADCAKHNKVQQMRTKQVQDLKPSHFPNVRLCMIGTLPAYKYIAAGGSGLLILFMQASYASSAHLANHRFADTSTTYSNRYHSLQ